MCLSGDTAHLPTVLLTAAERTCKSGNMCCSECHDPVEIRGAVCGHPERVVAELLEYTSLLFMDTRDCHDDPL